jgi:hypothetical protein
MNSQLAVNILIPGDDSEAIPIISGRLGTWLCTECTDKKTDDA